MEDITQQYPTFFKCSSKAAWTSLNNQANELLGFSNAGADNYSNPIIDANGKYWFVVNSDVSELVDLTKCLPYESITINRSM
jgi:hypothetical protein